MLAERVVVNAWRLRRVYRLESGTLMYQMLTAQAEQARSEADDSERGIRVLATPYDRKAYDKAMEVAERADRQRDSYQVAAGLVRDANGTNALSKLSRHETTLERGMYRALHELQRLQAARAGQVVPAPAVLDMDVSSEG